MKDTKKKSPTKKIAAKKSAARVSAKPVKKTVAAKKSAVSKRAPAAKKTAKKRTVAGTKSAVKKPAFRGSKKAPAKKSAGKPRTAKEKTFSTFEEFGDPKKDPTFAEIKKCWQALDDKKAEDLKVLDVRGRSPITNYFIIATATSEPHMKALAGELEKTLKENGVKAIGRDYKTESGWAVVDAFDFMAHIFLPEQRGLYGIESLWKDAEEINMA